MANKVPKEQKGSFYSRELEGARLRGDWDGDVAVTGGAKLAWSELIRKHLKHNPNDQFSPSIAGAEHRIRTALSAFYRQEQFSDISYQEDFARSDGSGKATFPPVLSQDQSGPGWSGQDFSEATQQLNNLRSSGRDNLSKQGVAAIQAYALFSGGQDEATVELLHEVRFLEDVDLASLKAGKVGEEYSLALIMMGYTVYGMANERLFLKRGDKGYIPFAYAGYACTIDLHESLRGGKSANALRGLQADEIEKWGETALYRNALLSVQLGNSVTALNALRAYQAHSGRWPANFRETQRLVIHRTYLRYLNQIIEKGGYTPPPINQTATRDDCRSAAYQTSVIAASASRAIIRDFASERGPRHSVSNGSTVTAVQSRGLGGATSRTVSTRRPAQHRGILPSGPSLWSNEFLTVQKAASDTVARSSHFPKAGEVNIIALELSDEIVRGWQLNGERGGDWADEVVEMLYILSRVTFHSQRIQRHLFTVLLASENYDEARRALELYIQIVEKAREGDAAEAGGLVEEGRRQEEGHEGPAEGEGALSAETKKKAEKMHIDSDTDQKYIETLLYGAFSSAKYLNDGQGADRLARKVIAFVDAEPDKTLGKDMALLARVKRIAGIARAALCASENNAATRSARQDEALALLKQSATLDDQSAETFYSLAYLQAEMLDNGNAIRSARRAVELEPAGIDYWHLLTLLVSSQKDYKGALRIAEEGLAEAEDDDAAGVNGDHPVSNGILSNGTSEKKSEPALMLSVDYPPRGTERAESILRLMITHNALEEITEGGQAAIEGQREIFEYFHRYIGVSWQAQGPRHKVGGLPGAVNGGEGGAGIAPRQGNRKTAQSTVLGGSQHQHHRFHSLTGLGQSGSHHHLLPIHSSAQTDHQVQDFTKSGNVGIPVMSQDEAEGEIGQSISTAQIRAKLQNSQRMHLLASLWLMAAATFRRRGELTECRTAIQEAERVDPGEAEVWLQLALWFELQPHRHDEGPSTELSIQCLYKALACKSDHVGATVHLARLFLSNPTSPSIKEVQEAIADVISPLPQTTDHVHTSPLASELLSHTQSRRITSSSAPGPGHEEAVGKGLKDVEAALDKERKELQEKRRLATVSLAEGLLVSVTQSNGWNVPEAWLYLGRVMKETKRGEKQRECLEYALQLEKAKAIRPLPLALKRV